MLGGAALVAAVLTGCDGDEGGDVTLHELEGTGAAAASAADTAGDAPAAGAGSTIEPSAAGSGVVVIHVRLPASGIDESLTLDRSTVRAEDLDPLSLDASCTPLDGGEEMAVSVLDLRRLAAGSRLVAAALTLEGGTTEGEHEARLDVSGADQVTTTFVGTASIAEGGWNGSFQATDAAGNAASGSFTCAAEAAVTTTTRVASAGEEVPGSDSTQPPAPAPTTAAPASTASPPPPTTAPG